MTLLDPLRGLERATEESVPAGRILGLIRSLKATVGDHMADEESRVFPVLQRREAASEPVIAGLKQEHVALRARLRTLAEQLEELPAEEAPAPEMCRDLRAWTTDLRDHEIKEMELLHEAYIRDFGSSE